VGTVARVSLVDATTLSVDNAPVSSGNFRFKVEGNVGTETLKIYWSRPTPADEIKIVKIEGSAGETIQP
jgi:hypothetical protein